MSASRIPLALSLSIALAACERASTSSHATHPPAAQSVTVKIRPALASILPGETVDFTWEVTGTADSSVTWEVVETGGGTVSGTGTYTAPLVTGVYTVRALSTVSGSSVGTAKVKVGRVAVQVSPTSATVSAGGVLTYTATVRGTKNTTVTWSLREPSGCGSIAPSGVYTAPGAAAICTIVATSVADPTAASEATAIVSAPPPASPPPPVAVTISPSSAAVDACRSVAFTATVSGASSGAVTWTVQEGSAGGSITSAGVYTAPASAGTYHVVATSQEAPASTAAVAVTVTERILGVAISPTSVTVAPGGSAQLTSTVTTTCGTSVAATTVAAPN